MYLYTCKTRTSCCLWHKKPENNIHIISNYYSVSKFSLVGKTNLVVVCPKGVYTVQPQGQGECWTTATLYTTHPPLSFIRNAIIICNPFSFLLFIAFLKCCYKPKLERKDMNSKHYYYCIIIRSNQYLS